jgi:hypothetical protein
MPVLPDACLPIRSGYRFRALAEKSAVGYDEPRRSFT